MEEGESSRVVNGSDHVDDALVAVQAIILYHQHDNLAHKLLGNGNPFGNRLGTRTGPSSRSCLDAGTTDRNTGSDTLAPNGKSSALKASVLVTGDRKYWCRNNSRGYDFDGHILYLPHIVSMKNYSGSCNFDTDRSVKVNDGRDIRDTNKRTPTKGHQIMIRYPIK